MLEVDTPAGVTRMTIDYQSTVFLPAFVQIRLNDLRTHEDVWLTIKGEHQVADFLDNIRTTLVKFDQSQARKEK
jgi:hypothetical protein